MNLLSLQEDLIEDLCIIPYEDFRLNQLCNLVFRKSERHTEETLLIFNSRIFSPHFARPLRFRCGDCVFICS